MVTGRYGCRDSRAGTKEGCTVSHPHVLSATSAAWSLTAALAQLHDRARQEARDIAMEVPAVLRSSSWGRRHALGGHGDPTTDAALSGTATTRINRYAVLLDGVTEHIGQMAGCWPDTVGDPLERIRAAVGVMRPRVAARTGEALEHLDGKIRRRLGILPDLAPVPGNPPCPACRLQMLRVQTSAPHPAEWTVICTAGCTCRGTDCGCGMPVRESGVPHIWTRTHVLNIATAA